MQTTTDDADRRYAAVEALALTLCCTSAVVGAALITVSGFDAVMAGMALGGIWLGTAMSLRQIAALLPVPTVRGMEPVPREWPVAKSLARGAIALFMLALMLAASRGFF